MINELYHHGILGMKWGVRRYQNEDGTLTSVGKKRYSTHLGDKGFVNPEQRAYKDGKLTPVGKEAKKVFDDLLKEYYPDEESITNERTRRDEFEDVYWERYFNTDPAMKSAINKKYSDFERNYKGDEIIDRAKSILKEKGNVIVTNSDGSDHGDRMNEATALLRLLDDSYGERIGEYDPKKVKHSDSSEDFLEHHGILGMKWGVRRYQDKDGKLTDVGKKRYFKDVDKVRKYEAKADKYKQKAIKAEKSAHRFWFRDVKAAYAKYSKYKYKSEEYTEKGEKLAKKILESSSDVRFDLWKTDDNASRYYLMKIATKGDPEHIAHLEFDSPNELYHWGILGMKWGVRRYQNKDGSLTSAGRSRYGSGKKKVGILEAHRIKKRKAEAAKKRAETLAKKKAEEETAQKHEAEKQEAIRSGNATQIAKFQNELSNQELREVLDRLGSKQRLSDMAAKETPKKLSKLDKATNIANKAAQAADIAEKGIKAYNTFAKITNTFADDDSQLPIIGEKKEKRNLSKEEAIKSGDPKILEAWKGKLTKEEVVQAYTIANNWQKIADMKLKPEQKEVLEQAGKAVIDNIASQSSSDKSTSKSETKTVSALDAYDTRSSYKSFEKEMKPKDDKKEKTSIFKPKEPEKYEYKPSTYDPNEHLSALWKTSFNPVESKKQDREAQQKRVDDLISKYSSSAGSDWYEYQSEKAYKKAKDKNRKS